MSLAHILALVALVATRSHARYAGDDIRYFELIDVSHDREV
ncbi:hypothetical protein [Luteimonas sp. 3794]|nr:hypothetical protein [Luteimonas sp. 3794]MDR6990678.1 hypothetical protein [Luteimonas sp. 3794]